MQKLALWSRAGDDFEVRRPGIICFVLGLTLALPAAAQTAEGEIIEVLPPKEDGETNAPDENPGQDSDDSAEWDYSASSSGSWGNDGGAGSVQVGLRLGFGLPLGEASKNNDLGDGLIGQIPLWLDVGYKVSPKVLIGLYASVGFLIFESASAPGDSGCPDGADCSGTDVRLGAQLHYFTNPGGPTSFWLGGGFGYEWFSVSVESSDSQVRGFEYINGQLGLDFASGDNTAVGPFAAITVGQFDKFKASIANQSSDGDIEQTGMHQWLMLGIRGTTDL